MEQENALIRMVSQPATACKMHIYACQPHKYNAITGSKPMVAGSIPAGCGTRITLKS
jgi:hypothetical protein